MALTRVGLLLVVAALLALAHYGHAKVVPCPKPKDKLFKPCGGLNDRRLLVHPAAGLTNEVPTGRALAHVAPASDDVDAANERSLLGGKKPKKGGHKRSLLEKRRKPKNGQKRSL